jgi:hypothetical protein
MLSSTTPLQHHFKEKHTRCHRFVKVAAPTSRQPIYVHSAGVQEWTILSEGLGVVEELLVNKRRNIPVTANCLFKNKELVLCTAGKRSKTGVIVIGSSEPINLHLSPLY